MLFEVWKVKIQGSVANNFHKALNESDIENWEVTVTYFKELLDAILAADSNFKDTYDAIQEELEFLSSPESYTDCEAGTGYELWGNQFNYIIDIMYDYCDKARIWIDPFHSMHESLDIGLNWGKVTSLSEFNEFQANIDELFYELNNTTRGVYTKVETYKELGEYIKDLATQLDNLGDIISLLEE